MPKLRLSFSGLCTFVLDPPLSTFAFQESPSEPATLSSVTILLQRLTRSRQLSNHVNLRPEVLDQHFPLLEFNLKDQPKRKKTSTDRRADFHCLPDDLGNMTKGVCLLNGEDLTVFHEGDKTPLTFSTLRPANPTNPQLTEEEEKSLFWMVSLEDALPGNATLDPRLIETQPGSNQPILARIRLTEGTLKTRDLTDLPYTIGGSVAPSRLNRRIATAFEVEMDVQSPVEITMLANRNGAEAERRLVLVSADGGDLEVGIANMEIDRFIGFDPASAPRVEADFEVYADLLARPLERDQPRPFLRQAGFGNSSGQGVSGCAPSGG
jgi:hypothetical protein